MPTDIALGLVTFIMAVLGGVVSAHAPTKPVIKAAYIIAFILLGAVGGVFIVRQSRETSEAEHKAEIAQNKLSNSVSDLGKAAIEAQRVAKLNTELQGRLIQSTKTIETLSLEALNATTGGNDFCYMDFPQGFVTDQGGTPDFIHVGNHPLYGLNVRIADLWKDGALWASGARPTLEALSSAEIHIALGDSAPGMAVIPPGFVIQFSPRDKQRFNLFFSSSRGGFWSEHLRLQKVNGQWLIAIRVFRSEGEKVINLMPPRIAKGYPRDAAGKVDWN